ncbi:MAG TPA: hypothetical protein DCY62_06015 [Thalassospira sp.]|nr:hypothetical protein [Thalassospira sp.]
MVKKFGKEIVRKHHSHHHAVRAVLALGAFLLWVWAVPAKAGDPVPVKVGAYEYGVVYYFEDGSPRGIVPMLIDRLNGLQDTYRFELAETSSRRRYQALMNGELDLILLESAKWDWPAFDVLYSDPIVREKDIYLTLASQSDAKSLFADVSAHPMLCVLGFHYGFADFNADPDYLRENFNVELRYNESEVLNGLLAGEAPIGIVSAGFLARRFASDPRLHERLIIGDKPDATYDLVSVLTRESAIPLDEFNALVARLLAGGEVEELWRQLHAGVSG